MKINGVVCRIKAEVDGTKYEPGPIKASEAERIQGWTGYTLREWESALVGEDDALAVKALLCLFRFRAGEHVKFADVEIEDMDSVTADFYDARGRKVTAQIGEDGKPVLVKGQPVLEFDGEQDSPPLG